MMDSKFVYKKHVKKATVTQLIFLFVFSGNNTVRGGHGGAFILPVATDNGRRSVPLGTLAHLQWIADVLRFAWIKIKLGNFNHSTCEYGSNRLTGVFCFRRRSSHKESIKYFHRRQSQTTAGLPAKLRLRSTSQGFSMRGTDYDSAINVHKGVCPRYVGGIREPGLTQFLSAVVHLLRKIGSISEKSKSEDNDKKCK